MNTSRKVIEWLTCFSNVNLMLECLLFKKFKKVNITNLTQYKFSQEEVDLLKAGSYFSIQPDKI